MTYCWLGTRTMALSRLACWPCREDDHTTEGSAIDLVAIAPRRTDTRKRWLTGPALGRSWIGQNAEFCRRQGSVVEAHLVGTVELPATHQHLVGIVRRIDGPEHLHAAPAGTPVLTACDLRQCVTVDYVH